MFERPSWLSGRSAKVEGAAQVGRLCTAEERLVALKRCQRLLWARGRHAQSKIRLVRDRKRQRHGEHAGVAFGAVLDVELAEVYELSADRDLSAHKCVGNVGAQMGSTLDGFKENARLKGELNAERIRGAINKMIEQQLQERSMPRP